MSKKTKRVLICSDMHCGHLSGLTPSSWLYETKEDTSSYLKITNKYRKEAYKTFKNMVKSKGKIDILIVNADTIDGRGEKSGGTELITTDRNNQCDMAVELIEEIKSNQIYMTYGTPYHTGKEEDWEDVIANRLNADIKDQQWLNINGLVFNIKHKVGSSSVPYGRSTAINKEKTWNYIQEARGEAPKANIIIRSHVHYFNYSGSDDWLGITTPALQGPFSKFGLRQCSGITHFGILCFDVTPSGNFTWEWDIKKISNNNQLLIKA